MEGINASDECIFHLPLLLSLVVSTLQTEQNLKIEYEQNTGNCEVGEWSGGGE